MVSNKIDQETRARMIEEAKDVAYGVGWPKSYTIPAISPEWSSTNIGVLTVGKGKKWNTSEEKIARNIVSFVVGYPVMNVGNSSGTPSLARCAEVLKTVFGSGKKYENGTQLMAHISDLLDECTVEDTAPSADDAPPADEAPPATTVVANDAPPAPTATVVSDAVMIDAIPEQSIDANTWVMMERTGTNTVEDALNATQFKSSKATSKEKNGWASCHRGFIHEDNENHGTFANGTLGSYAFGKGKNGNFNFGKMLLLFSDDLFSAIGVKSFALNMLRDNYDCFEDMTALVHAVGSMDARKHISHDVKVAFLTKHIRYEDAWDANSILPLDGKRATPTGSLTASQERSKEFFNGLF
jgi:hypothetical protein